MHVAMESTGVYWKPVWNIVEGNTLANAQLVKNVPGRKTDEKDAEWLLGGLDPRASQLGASVVQTGQLYPESVGNANNQTRQRRERDFRQSGMAMLETIIAGQDDAVRLPNLARGLLRAKIPQLRLEALEGLVREHRRILLERLLA